MFKTMIKYNIGTGEVEAAARRVEGKNKPRNSREVNRIMRKRLVNIERDTRKFRHEWYKNKDDLKKGIGIRLSRSYEKIERRDRRRVWNNAKEISRNKVKFARKKYGMNPSKNNQPERFYKVTDEELANESQPEVFDNYVVYGNVILSDNEKKCLNLGPKFMITPELSRENYEVEVEVEAVKTRMEVHKINEIKEARIENVEEERIREEKEDKQSRKVYDEETCVMQMSKLRVTDAKYNTRSFPPREVDKSNELLIQVRNGECMSIFDEVKREICNKKGKLKESNLTRDEQKGKVKLMQRAQKGELIVTMTDKSGKFAVVEPQMYKRAAAVHLNDRKIELTEVTETETLMNRHAQQIVKSLKMGTIHGKNGQVERIRRAFTSVNGQPGPMYFLVKDHKMVKTGEEMPPTRPVCSAKGGPGARLSNLISQVLNYAADSAKSSTECMSTEEAKYKILETNRKLNAAVESGTKKDVVLMSMDVKALYPSLRVEEVVGIVYEMMARLLAEKKFVIRDIDWDEVGKYIAIVCTSDEIRDKKLVTAIPKRARGEGTRGKKPGPAYWESNIIDVKDTNGEIRKINKWIPAKESTDLQKNRMFALMMSKAVEVSMKNHMYRFDGNVYKQEDGGPIGDELSQAVARIVMMWWDEKFLERCSKLDVDVLMYTRYVDDANLAVVPLGRRMAFDGAKLTSTEKEEQDANKEIDKETAEKITQIANQITPMIKMEEDVASNYENRKLPILDLLVWVESDDQSNPKIMHSFYKKPMSSKLTLRSKTAYPPSKVRAMMVEETLRRLRNCSPEMSWNERGAHLTQFAKELKSSGHTENFRVAVFNAAIRKFVNEMKKHNEGKKDMYRSREQREKDMKERGGKTSNDNWFKKNDKRNKRTTSVLNVPFTSNSTLVKKTRNKLGKMKAPEGTHTIILESGGTKLRDQLIKSDPFPNKECGRKDCKMPECKERCYAGHVNYTIVCKSCESINHCEKYVYMGESSRGGYIRYKQHFNKYKTKSGFMWDHDVLKHGGTGEVEFEVERVVKDGDPLRRVIRESVKLQHTNREEGCRDGNGVVVNLMNRKNEYFGMMTVQVNFERD